MSYLTWIMPHGMGWSCSRLDLQSVPVMMTTVTPVSMTTSVMARTMTVMSSLMMTPLGTSEHLGILRDFPAQDLAYLVAGAGIMMATKG